jgi:hypothetical protein
VGARFDRDCPPSLPRRRAAEGIPNLDIDGDDRSCTRVIRGEGSSAVRRTVALDQVNDETQPDQEPGQERIQAIDIDYAWVARNARVPLVTECDTVIEEAVGYLRDLTGVSEERARLVAAAMRAHHGKLIRFVVMDREICASSAALPFVSPDSLLEDERGEGTCGAGFTDCALLRTRQPPLSVNLDVFKAGANAGGTHGQ